MCNESGFWGRRQFEAKQDVPKAILSALKMHGDGLTWVEGSAGVKRQGSG